MDVVLAKNLYRWAKNNPDNYARLEEWLEAAITDIADGKGLQLQSTTANGVSVAFASSGTVTDWFNTLSQALSYCDSPPVSKIRGVIR